MIDTNHLPEQMPFAGDLIITDPMYLVKKDSLGDWDLLLSEGYDHAALHLLGITHALSIEAGEDSSRCVFDQNGNRIGRFCCDSALFCICDLKQVLSYHPAFFAENERYPNTFCVIRNFCGMVYVTRDETDRCCIIGDGENGFRTN